MPSYDAFQYAPFLHVEILELYVVMILELQLVLVSFCSKFICLDIIALLVVPRLVVKCIGNHSDPFELVGAEEVR